MSRIACGGQSRGFTLVELVISLVVISIALGGVLMVMNYTVQHSADPMLEHQAVAIAEAYLEEVLPKPFADLDTSDSESERYLLDDVDDYNNWSDSGAHDQNGNAIGGLENYTVSVTVANVALNGISAADCKLVTVTVSHPAGINLSLSGFRTDY